MQCQDHPQWAGKHHTPAQDQDKQTDATLQGGWIPQCTLDRGQMLSPSSCHHTIDMSELTNLHTCCYSCSNWHVSLSNPTHRCPTRAWSSWKGVAWVWQGGTYPLHGSKAARRMQAVSSFPEGGASQNPCGKAIWRTMHLRWAAQAPDPSDTGWHAVSLRCSSTCHGLDGRNPRFGDSTNGGELWRAVAVGAVCWPLKWGVENAIKLGNSPSQRPGKHQGDLGGRLPNIIHRAD